MNVVIDEHCIIALIYKDFETPEILQEQVSGDVS